MAKKVSKKIDKAAKQVENVVILQPTVTPHLIVAQRKFDRWYVYFQGVAPKDNVGCGYQETATGFVGAGLFAGRFHTRRQT